MKQPLTIYVMQSAHTDIGYTHPQEQIASMYLDFYDEVLDLCQRTEHEPEEQRFKWTCETFWQVHNYLKQRPEREQEFLHYVRLGQIEITASYLHFTDLIDADAYRRSVALAVEYCRRHDLPLKTAMHCDINGWPWAAADIFAEFNIPYFCSQVHIDSGTDPLGERGSIHYSWKLERQAYVRQDAPIRVPQAFWWQGPAGGRVLHWLNEHYNLGNVLSLSGSKNFGVDKTRYYIETDRMSADELYAAALQEVPRYVEQLQAAHYPHSIYLMSTAGYYVDNSPPDSRWCQIIERWNREHEDIHLRTTTLSEWFEALQAEQSSDQYPTYQLAWPDYWSHGIGSETARIALARRTQRRRADIIELVEQAQSPAAQRDLEIALEQERLSIEHTFGAWSTTGRPSSPLNSFQQGVKELFFQRAELFYSEAAGAALRASTVPAADTRQIAVGGSVREDGLHLVHFNTEDEAVDPAQSALCAEDGQIYPLQEDNQELNTFVAALPLRSQQRSHFRLIARTEQPRTLPVTQDETLIHIESASWRISIDKVHGGLRSLRERATDREWVDGKHQYGFGQLVNELVIHPRGREAVGNVARFIALDIATDTLKQSFPDAPVFARSSVVMDDDIVVIAGPVFDEVSLRGSHPQHGSARVNWRCYHALPVVELVIDWDKPWSALPEATYVAFPFALEQGTLALETGGGFFHPGSHATGGQLPGTCANYYTIQRAAQLTAQDGATGFWLPLDAPLVMPNEINFNHWETEPWQWNGFLASMPVNHYWHTNFPVNQRGPLRLRYRFVSQQGFASAEQAIQAAQSVEALGWH